MCYFIDSEILITNALIELNQDGIREVDFATIERYGNAVVEELRSRGERAVVRSGGGTNLVREQSRFYDFTNPKLLSGTVKMKDGITSQDLASSFCGGTSLTVLEALLSKRALGALRAA